MFECLAANRTLKDMLAVMINGQRLSHAILLQGEAGTGKRTLARLTAQAVLCRGNPGGERPCGVCSSCRKAEKGIHPDIIEMGAEALRPQSFHIDTVRQLRQEAFIAPNESSSKLYILHNVQNMTAQAQNALLKILEEPPETVIFILLCENRSALLETVLSRCVSFTLEPPDEQTCCRVLMERKPGLPQERYQAAAIEAEGNVGRALLLLDPESSEGELSAQAWEGAQNLLRDICGGDEFVLLASLGRYEKQKEAFVRLLPCLKQMAKEAALKKYSGGSPGMGSLPAVREAASRLSTLQIMKILAIIDTVSQRIRQNVNFNLVLASFCAEASGSVR